MDLDPLSQKIWQKLHDEEWVCPCCDEKHNGLFDLACSKPDFWQGEDKHKPNSEFQLADNILTEDVCIIDGKHFFVRCVLPIPIVNTDQDFGFGTWVTLSQKNFQIYMETFDEGNQGDLGPWFGWFSNRLKGYPDTINLKCQIYPQEGRIRPLIELEPTDHPLSIAQRDGISFDEALDIYARYGHDFRKALAE